MVLRWLANIDSKLLNKQNETIKTTISCIRVGKWEKTFKLALPSAEENKWTRQEKCLVWYTVDEEEE